MIDWSNKKDELEDLIVTQQKSYEEIGRMYGCSGANIKKRAKKLHIGITPRRVINEKETFNKGVSLKEVLYSYQDKCPKCGGLKCKTANLCSSCANKEKKQIGTKELGYYIGYGKNRMHYATRKCQEIRKDAQQRLNNSDIEKVCSICHNHEFDDILEVHHKKGILDFDEHSLIDEINSLDNLMWVCPNHHTLIHKNKIKA